MSGNKIRIARWWWRVRTKARCCCCCCFFFNDTATTEIYTLSLHDALPILFFCWSSVKACWSHICRNPSCMDFWSMNSQSSGKLNLQYFQPHRLTCMLLGWQWITLDTHLERCCQNQLSPILHWCRIQLSLVTIYFSKNTNGYLVIYQREHLQTPVGTEIVCYLLEWFH